MFQTTLESLIKYALEGIAVSVAAFYLTNKKTPQEVAMLGLVAAATFMILDLFAPMVGVGARHGSGFGVGLGLVGGADEEQLQDMMD